MSAMEIRGNATADVISTAACKGPAAAAYSVGLCSGRIVVAPVAQSSAKRQRFFNPLQAENYRRLTSHKSTLARLRRDSQRDNATDESHAETIWRNAECYPGSMLECSVLFRNDSRTVWLLDLPRSIEECQLGSRDLRSAEAPLLPRRLLSGPPPDSPFPTPEPSSSSGVVNASTAASQVADLMTMAAVSDALQELRRDYSGPHCLPRISTGKTLGTQDSNSVEEEKDFFVPGSSNYVSGTIQDTRDEFLARAPKFDLIVLDPPWPNRSARRKKKGYGTAPTTDAVRDLLSLIPVTSILAQDGFLAIWVTNKPAFTELLTSAQGIFREWGVELVDTWTWLKITANGEPIFNLESQWRKPWERLLIARRIGSRQRLQGSSQVIIAVPDLHSRKPNLRRLFEESLPEDYAGLEVFARNLTAGWWSWGNEVLHYQQRRHWLDTTHA